MVLSWAWGDANRQRECPGDVSPHAQAVHRGNAPKDVLLSGLAHGEWIQTGTHEFAYTAFALNSTLSVAFTRYVKVNATLDLNDTSGELTQTWTISVFFPDGTLDVSFQGPTRVFKRIVAGQ